MDIINLTRKISALRAMTAPDSITPEVLGSLLQQIADLIGALNQIDTSEATDLITRVSAAEANAETARQAAQNALTASEANVIDSFSFDQTGTVLQLSLKQHGHEAVLLNLPGATTTFAGILTATDKYHLDVAYNKYLKQLTTSSYADRVTLNYKRHDDTVTQVTFVGASTYEAGLMTAADKVKLETAVSNITALQQWQANAYSMMEISFAGLDANGLVKSELLQRNMLFNIDADADLSGLTPGDIFFSDGSLFMYEYTNNHGSRISSPVGDPQTDIIYCHKSTGLLYKWDSSGGVFIRFGINLDGNGRMSSSQATPQVMKSMGSTLDNAGNTGNTQVYVTLNVGDTYFDPSEGKIFYKKSSSVEIDLGAPSKLLIYANAQSNKLYRWSGSAMVELG
jgi:hypothetical protein